MGDFHAGLGVYDFARSQTYGGISAYEYCPPDANEITRNRARLRQAQDYYQKAVSLLNEFQVQSVAQYDVFTRLAVVKVSLRLATYQYVRPPSFCSLPGATSSSSELFGQRLVNKGHRY